MNTKWSTSLMRLGLILVVVLTALLPEQTAHAATMVRYASPYGIGNGDCMNWPSACDLQHALAVAVSGDQIWVMQGVHPPTTTDDRSASFWLKNGVAIYGGFLGSETLLSQRDYKTNVTVLSGDIGAVGVPGDNSYNVVKANAVDETAILDGFTITSGYAETDGIANGGAGVLVWLAAPKLRNLVITGNTAKYGAGMVNLNGSSPVLTNVVFTSNLSVATEGISTGGGGGMYNNDSTPVLNNVSFIANSTQFSGGGLYTTGSRIPRLNHVRFSSNWAAFTGGGLAVYSNNPMLTAVTFNGNQATRGGGMYNDSSSPSLINTTFSGNQAFYSGGGMFNENGGKPKLTNVRFSNNQSNVYGGGMYNLSSNPSLTNVVFAANRSDSGGGMYNENGNAPSLTKVTFAGNTANFGGGIYNYIANARLTNVTFNANTAALKGGAIFSYGSSPVLKYVTIVGNQAPAGQGGGLYNENSNPQVLHSIIWGNVGGQYVNVTNSTGAIKNSIVAGASCPAGATCTNRINQSPKLAPLANNGGFTQTMALKPGSPAIDRIFCMTGVPTDQRGIPRPQGVRCDIGAYEFKP